MKCRNSALRTVTDDARSHHDPHIRVLVAEPVDVVDHVLALAGIEDFIQAVQQQDNATALAEQKVERLAVQPVPRGRLVEKSHKVFFGEAVPAVVIPQFDEQR